MTWTVQMPWWVWLSPLFALIAFGAVVTTAMDYYSIRERKFTRLLWPTFIAMGLFGGLLSYVVAVLSE